MGFLRLSLIVLCCASIASAEVVYDVDADWVNLPGAPVNWDFGFRVQTVWGTGVFGSFSPMIHADPPIWGSPPDGDQWAGEVSAPHYTLSIWKVDPWNLLDTGMMVWVNYSPV